MPDPTELDMDDDLSPSDKDPAEGADDMTETKGRAPHTPSHLGPAGDPAEGKA
jgi:hypothetical protein